MWGHFCFCQVGVYTGMWEHKKPRTGVELNKPAEVTMTHVFPEGGSAGTASRQAIAQFEKDLRAYAE